MSTTLYGKGFLVTPTNYALGPNGVVSGYVAPLVRTPQIMQEASAISRLKSVAGVVFGLIDPVDCILKATLAYVPAGATLAEAAKSAMLPENGPYTITAMPIIKAGLFTDCWNTNGTNTQPWFYFGEGEITGAEDQQAWTGSITLYRFFGITSGTPVT